jgi:hypothetical protein
MSSAYVAASVYLVARRLVGAALVHRDLVRPPVRCHCLVEEALGCCHVALSRQQEVDGLTLLVNGKVEIFPDAFYLDVRIKLTLPYVMTLLLIRSGRNARRHSSALQVWRTMRPSATIGEIASIASRIY